MNRDPFALSAAYAIDPAYSTTTCRPAKTGLSLWSTKQTGPLWLYTPGNLEAWLFDRSRREAFSTCMNICHPGRYRTVQPTLYAHHNLELTAVPATVPCQLYFDGIIHFIINGRTVYHAVGSSTPQMISLDLAPFLKPQKNHIRIRVISELGPPTALLDSSCFHTDANWTVSTDDQQWHPPRCFPLEGTARFPHQEELPEIPVPLQVDQNGLYDAGVQLLARAVITAQGHGSISVHPGESEAEAIDPAPDACEQVIPVLPVAESGEFKTTDKLAFRYLRLVHDTGVEITGVQTAASFYPTRYQGAFACSDSRLTAIWMHAAYTLRACMQLTFVDGLKRDRLPWVGDLYVCNLSNYPSFFEPAISEFSLAALMGEAPDEADINGTITYSLFWVMAARDHALFCGDSPFLKSLLAYCDKLMAAISSKADTRGLLPSHRFPWIYVDWAEVHTAGYSSFLNCLYVMALDAAAELHVAAGNTDQAYAVQANTLRETCRTTFWDPAQKLFIDNVEATKQGAHFSRQCNALAILSGVCTSAQRTDLLRNVLLNPHVAPVGTPYMMYFEARALALCNERDAMLSMLHAYWGNMIEAGATTFWEAHDLTLQGDQHYAFYGRPYGKSLCHAWSSGPLHLLSLELFGLRPTKCGWQEFTIQPANFNLEWACVETPTPHGPIRIEQAGKHLTLTFPKGTTLVRNSGNSIQRHEGPACVEFKI